MLEIFFNRFNASIPRRFDICSMLEGLKADQNNLSGGLPDDIFNGTSREYLSSLNNHLYEVLDGARIINLTNLAKLIFERISSMAISHSL
jgi:hypothetical protein